MELWLTEDLILKGQPMLMPLCSLARNPDGSLRRPTAYEINATEVHNLLIAAVVTLALIFVLAGVQYMRNRRGMGFVFGLMGLLLMAIHPSRTISTDTGDCGGFQAIASWLVTGILGAFLLIQLCVLRRSGTDDRWHRADYGDY